MKGTALFRWVWTVNGLIAMIIGLVAVIAIALAGLDKFAEWRRNLTTKANNTVNVNSDSLISSEWKLGGFDKIKGTDYLMSPVFSTQEYQLNSMREKETSAIRNYLFLKSVDKSSHWLVPNNDFLFLEVVKIKQKFEETESLNANVMTGESPIKCLKYTVIKTDSNSDGRLTTNDWRTIAFSEANGGNYTELINDVDVILSETRQSDDVMLIFYRTREKKNLVSEIDLKNLKVVVTKALPKLN